MLLFFFFYLVKSDFLFQFIDVYQTSFFNFEPARYGFFFAFNYRVFQRTFSHTFLLFYGTSSETEFL